jgi:hypothetical protein
VLAVYRPNNDFSSFCFQFEQIISTLDKSKLFITGDLNINTFDTNCNSVASYLDMLLSFDLKIINSVSTRQKSLFSKEGTLIDHCILSNDFERYVSMTSTRITAMSDHNFILCMLAPEIKQDTTTRLTRSRLNENLAISLITEKLSSLPCNTPHLRAIDYFTLIHSIYVRTIESCTKIVTIKLPKNENTLPAWANDHYIEMLKSLHNLDDKIERFKRLNKPCSLLEEKYRDLDETRTKYGSVIAQKFYRSIQISNRSQAWSIINELTGRAKSKQLIALKTPEGDLITGEQQIAEAFQKKFLSIVGTASAPVSHLGYNFLGNFVSTTFSFLPVTRSEIDLCIFQLENKKSCGLDGITSAILKNTHFFLSSHFANIFNLIICEARYPAILKSALVVPVPKKGDLTCVDNYRPISLLSAFDKILENLLQQQLAKYFEENRLLDSHQYGFRSRRGCADAIGMLLHSVSLHADKSKSVLVISFDISKAFDSVNLNILLHKLYCLGIRGKSLDLLEDFLKSRHQLVRYSQARSSSGEILKGVPQGSNLGPMLFNILINDLRQITTHSLLIKFADDLALIMVIDPPPKTKVKCPTLSNVEKISADLNTLAEYYKMNDLSLNCSKSKALQIGNVHDPDLIEFLKRKGIENCEKLAYLGVSIDIKLKFTFQIDAVAKHLGHGIFALRHLIEHSSIDNAIQFYHAHLHSHLLFCSFALLRCRSIDIERLQRLQNKALKTIFGLPPRYHTHDLFNNYALPRRILSVIGCIYMSAITLVHKCIHSDDRSLPTIRLQAHSANLDLHLHTAKKKVLKDDVSHCGAKLFNQLPDSIKRISCHGSFKEELKKFILEHTDSLLKPGQFTSRSFFI